MLSASDTLKQRGGGGDKDWDGADSGPALIRTGTEPTSCGNLNDTKEESNQAKAERM